MKIYFAGSLRAGRDDQKLYQELIGWLGEYGTVLTEHVGYKDALAHEIETLKQSEEDIYKQDVSWLKESDIVIAEVTQPSLGVGYEIAKAEEWNKKIICLFRPSSKRSLSAMIAGSPHVEVIEYKTLDDLKPQLEQLLT